MYLLPQPATEVGELRGARQTLEHRVRVEVGVLTVAHQSLEEEGDRTCVALEPHLSVYFMAKNCRA